MKRQWNPGDGVIQVFLARREGMRGGRGMNASGGGMGRLIGSGDLHVGMAAGRDAWKEGGARRQPARLGLPTRASSPE